MNLDHATVVFRERTFPEIYDLAIALTRRHAGALAALTLIGVAPWAALDWWLLAGRDSGSLYWAWVLLAAQAPLATAPITAYVGTAMFDRAPSVRAALRDAGTRAPALLALAVVRAVAAMTVIGLPLTPAHLVEALVLERQPAVAAWRRAWSLLGDWIGEHILHLLVAIVALVAGVAISLLGGDRLLDLVGWGGGGEEPDDWYTPGRSPWLLLAPWPIIAFLAVARLVAYIDLRTRLEAWDVEIELRRAGQRLRNLA